jgi:hypothetical protein
MILMSAIFGLFQQNFGPHYLARRTGSLPPDTTTLPISRDFLRRHRRRKSLIAGHDTPLSVNISDFKPFIPLD